MDIKINYDKLVKTLTDDGKETSIESALENMKQFCLEQKLPVKAFQKFSAFLLQMKKNGAATVEDALKIFLAGYISNGRVGKEICADKKYVEKQFFTFMDDFEKIAYFYEDDCYHFPIYANVKADYDWSALLDLIDPEVLQNRYLYTEQKYRIQFYFYECLDPNYYDNKIRTRMPDLTFNEFLYYYKDDKENQK